MKRRVIRPGPDDSIPLDAPPNVSSPTSVVDGLNIAPTGPRLDPRLRQAIALVVAIFLSGVGISLTPPPGLSASSGLAGFPRLGLYLLAAIVLAASQHSALTPLRDFSRNRPDETPQGSAAPSEDRSDAVGSRNFASPILLLIVGIGISCALAGWNVIRLHQNIEDGLGHALWLGSMAMIVGFTLAPTLLNEQWGARWSNMADFDSGPKSSSPRRKLPWILLASLIAVAVAARFPALGTLPIGIQADEGDRANWALRVLDGVAPATWFGDGWYLINLVYFRLLAASMSIFGTSVAGTRTLSAIAGTGFVAVVAWIGCRHFGWRTGLLATALATTGALYVQQSRFIGESGLTALLCAVSLSGFLEGGRTGRFWAFAVAGLSGGLSLYFYPSGRLWVVGAAVTVIILFLTQPRASRPGLVRGVIVAAAGALIAVTPFLVHLESNPRVLTTRYDETSVLVARNQDRLTYFNPPVPMAELLALQLERTLGMFDRYSDGVSFLPTSRPAMPSPLGALTIIGIFFVAAQSLRDPRYAIISVWFAIGIAGVFFTVETPDFLRASGALVTLPLFAAIVVGNVAERLGSLVSTVRPSLPATGLVRGSQISASVVGAIAVAALLGQGYLYFRVYPSLMAPSWSYATREGLQIDRLGQTGPVAGIDMFEFQVNSGWVRFLAQGVTIDQLPNPGAQAPILYTEDSSPGDAAFSLRQRPEQSLSFVLYPDPNQSAFVGFLAGLFPEGRLEAPIDGRSAFVVPATAVGNAFGASVRVGDAPAVVHVASLGALPEGFVGPASVEWHAGFRLPRSGRYKLKLTSSHPASVDIDGVRIVRASGGNPDIVEFAGARGVHYIRLTAEAVTSSDQIVVARTGQNASSSAGVFHELGRSELFATMDGPWGMLGHVVRSGNAETGAANVADSFVDSAIAAIDLPRYVSIEPFPSTIVWEGTLIAPRDGIYRFGIATDGTTSVDLDGHPVDVPAIKWEAWKDNLAGSQIHLTAGPHPLALTLRLSNGGRSVVRLNWVLPKANGLLDGGGTWSVVPPNALRAPAAVWIP